MPACGPQLPQLTPEQAAQVIGMVGSMPCEDMARFGAQTGGSPAAGDSNEDDGDL